MNLFPLHKLEKLPRHQRLRKTAKIFTGAETRLCRADGALTADEGNALAAIADLLCADALFPPAVQAAFAEAAALLRAAAGVDEDSGPAGRAAQTRRAVNTVRHLLLSETGRSPADWDFIGAGGKLDPARRRSFPGMWVYLEDIRSPFNVGAMFRTAESFGAEKIILSPFCADPRHPRSQRSAMGCTAALPWERSDHLFSSSQTLPLFALETGGTPLGDFVFPRQGILIAGSEELGVSPSALAAASLGRVSIPCYGAKGSLNVSVAFGIVMQAWAAANTAAAGLSPRNRPGNN